MIEGDPAGQLERLVTLVNQNPFTSFVIILGLLLVMGFRKDGLFSKFLDLLTERARREAARENRRIEMMHMIENRPQAPIPGLEEK